MTDTRKSNRKQEHIPTRDVNAAQRAALALKLRASKVKYEEIARQCGYASAGAAHRAVQREMSRTVVTNVEELRKEEMETLDLIQTECMKVFLDQNARSRLFAADRLIAVMERRARLLGMDLPSAGQGAGLKAVVRLAPAGYLPTEYVEGKPL